MSPTSKQTGRWGRTPANRRKNAEEGDIELGEPVGLEASGQSQHPGRCTVMDSIDGCLQTDRLLPQWRRDRWLLRCVISCLGLAGNHSLCGYHVMGGPSEH